ncbi:D-alanyl-D-alanine carboxypeptidase [Mesorhizobium sp. CAU 1741]|uniref:D-alanyl-D-alanine carboxypeptidase n=1 Tax=Mesorhizobium sp. CAU 1741 TaxID=3140366 RepID=UPI00325A6C22
MAGFISHISTLPKFLVITLVSAAMLTLGSMGDASANSRYAAYVIDAKTGKVLFARNADAKRYPASLTKMMTLYLVFEAIEAKRISTNTPIPFSKNAAAEQPTKLGVRAGGSITVDTAIRALVTRSANDVSTAIGEMLGGSEAGFAKMMTRKAHQLGMNSTQFRNAHGLPNNQQFTSARDMAILGMALREHFPQHYAYFSTRSFMYGKQRITTHNRMFGRIEGVDGIKTGYIRASGFNLVTSVQDKGRSIVAVVMGGQSARSRDDHMAALIREHLPRASRSGGGNLVPGRQLTPGSALVASAFSLPQRDIPTPSFRPVAEADLPLVAYAQETAPSVAPMPVATASAGPIPPLPVASVPLPSASAERFTAEVGAVDPVMTSSTQQSGWAVQIASSPSQGDAFAALVRVGKEASTVLGSANAFIEEFNNKGTTFYRARFGGFGSKSQAWNTCDALKKQRIDCFAAEL